MSEKFAELTSEQQAVVLAWTFRNWVSSVRAGQSLGWFLPSASIYLTNCQESLSSEDIVLRLMENHEEHGRLAESVYSGRPFESLSQYRQEELIAYETAMRLMGDVPEQSVGRACFDALSEQEQGTITGFVTRLCREITTMPGGEYYGEHEADLIPAYEAAVASDPVVVRRLMNRKDFTETTEPFRLEAGQNIYEQEPFADIINSILENQLRPHYDHWSRTNDEWHTKLLRKAISYFAFAYMQPGEDGVPRRETGLRDYIEKDAYWSNHAELAQDIVTALQHYPYWAEYIKLCRMDFSQKYKEMGIPQVHKAHPPEPAVTYYNWLVIRDSIEGKRECSPLKEAAVMDDVLQDPAKTNEIRSWVDEVTGRSEPRGRIKELMEEPPGADRAADSGFVEGERCVAASFSPPSTRTPFHSHGLGGELWQKPAWSEGITVSIPAGPHRIR